MLLAANFKEATLDAYDTNLTLVAQFSDAHAPGGYAPFNVHNFSGTVLVTLAKQDDAKHDDVPGRGHGLIDIFDASTGMFHRVVTGSDAGGKLHEIDSPWGMELAPSTLGKHAGQLLVGNFGKRDHYGVRHPRNFPWSAKRRASWRRGHRWFMGAHFRQWRPGRKPEYTLFYGGSR
jgi:uncharacterized protein (TIGR03118 family)